VQVSVGHPPIRRIHTTSYWVVLRIVFLRDTMTLVPGSSRLRRHQGIQRGFAPFTNNYAIFLDIFEPFANCIHPGYDIQYA
jgi:hypothetical protein